ncbi:MAG TPA: carboxypeptidase-like regulatory domain-containing protein [Terriglobales bacterium]|nr:carboxypeptidase-like regulatory domain-containing protein [Terriglobales bacterium]
MTRKLGYLVMVVALALPAAAGELGSISGMVRNSTGVPQMGAIVEVLGPNNFSTTVFTDARGAYTATGLGAGVYELKVTAPSFLPSLRENVGLRSGASMVVNVTLNTLFEAMQLVPIRQRVPEDDDDWKWTLRSMSNRPVLRVLDDGPLVVVSRSDRSDDKVLKARVAFLAGSESEGFGGAAEMTTSFRLEHSLFSSGKISFDGDVGYNGTVVPGTVFRASYSHQMPNGSKPEVALTVRRFATPELAAHNAALQALALSLSDSITFGNVVDLSFGSELQSIQFLGRVTAARPFGSVDVHLSPNTVVGYRYATSAPNMRAAKGFDSAPADLSESGPRMSMRDWEPVLERARHHELSVSRRIGRNKLQLAYYSDRISNPVLTGVGDVNSDTGLLLPDIYSGTFSLTGRDLSTRGVRVVYQRKLMEDLTATVDYSLGGVLDIADGVGIENVRNLAHVTKRHSLAYKVAGKVPRYNTRWIASYKWTSGDAITPVDMFNAGPGQSDPFLNVFVRQPIPGTGFMPGNVEAMVDVRNLLAQGYVPVIGQDGQTVYLVQSGRAVRGGVSFTF